ncbi:unnamed protein product [Phaeothamnion confervicola]
MNHDIIATARAFGRDVIEPNAEAWQRAGTVPREYFRAAGEAGLCRLRVAISDGGLGLDAAHYTEVMSILAAHCMASTVALVVQNTMTTSLACDGNTALKARYLAAMMRGELIGAFLLSEPQAGSDAAAIATIATQDGAGWRVSGEKAWISNGVLADVLAVYAQTSDSARDMACFVIDSNAAGVSRRPGYELLGAHAIGTAGFSFAHAQVAATQVLQAPGGAFRGAMATLDLARLTVAAMCCGMLGRALDEALTYTRQRPAFGGVIADLQAVQFLLADVATDLEAARALTARAADAQLRKVGASVACAHAKKFATRVAFTRIADCMQVMGAAGLSRALPLARHLECAKVAQYLDGATEIQNVVIARHLFA